MRGRGRWRWEERGGGWMEGEEGAEKEEWFRCRAG